MNLFEEAAAFMAQHPKTQKEDSFLQTFDSREKFLRELKMLYENATNNEIEKAVPPLLSIAIAKEIEKALDGVLSQQTPPYDKDQILKKIRPKLED